jgi:sodium-coupled neutral amino acid transporter 9
LTAQDLLKVASINGFAFICHPSISPIVKEHYNQKKNEKAIYLGFLICIGMYILVGVFGALAIYGRVPPMQKDSYNIIDYFSGSFQAPVLGLLNCAYLFMISPIFPFVSKSQAVQLIPKEKREKIPKLWLKSTIVFALVWVPLNTLFIVLDTSPMVVIGFVSTVMAFFCTYLLPIIMTLKVGDYIAKQTVQVV